jgi:hypothetical protein
MHDRQISVHRVTDDLAIPKNSVHEIVDDHWGLNMVRTPWVPKSLTPLQRANRVDCFQELLEESEADPFNFTIGW